MTNEMNNFELCAFCGKLAVKTAHKDKLFGRGEQAVVIENLPLKQCAACGESYYEPETSQMIDQLLSHPERQAVIRQVNVVSLAA
ncbi:MAG: type II toxin-antitoxin system MqsA family antitoxin [Acidobacteriota bacterium]